MLQKKPIVRLIAVLLGVFVFPTLSAAQNTVRVAVVQLKSQQVGDFSAMTSLALEAASGGAKLVIFPESSALGWLNPSVFTNAAPIPGATSISLATIAVSAGVWVAASVAERGPPILVGGAPTGFYYAYDSGLLINPQGLIVLHHRKHNVLLNAFNPADCPPGFVGGCNYSAGLLSDITVAQTPFGRTAILVCADAYTRDTTTLQALKALMPEFVIVPWGVTAGALAECGQESFNATGFAAKAAAFLQTAYVVGANAVGTRPYGRFLPSWYCGTSGYATPAGTVGGVADTQQEIAFFDIPVAGQ